VAALYVIAACVALYAIAGWVCFDPTSAAYLVERGGTAQDQWFARSEDLHSAGTTDPLRKTASGVGPVHSPSPAAGHRDEFPARLVGPGPRTWLMRYGTGLVLARAALRPWIRCWWMLQRGHFPQHRNFVLPLRRVEEDAARGSLVAWQHVICVTWNQ
jgi:hypothetical protein